MTLYLIIPLPPRSTLFPYTTLFRSNQCIRLRINHLSGVQFSVLMVSALHRGPIITSCASGMPTAEPSYTLWRIMSRSEEHTSELQSRLHLVCRLLLEKKKRINNNEI